MCLSCKETSRNIIPFPRIFNLLNPGIRYRAGKAGSEEVIGGGVEVCFTGADWAVRPVCGGGRPGQARQMAVEPGLVRSGGNSPPASGEHCAGPPGNAHSVKPGHCSYGWDSTDSGHYFACGAELFFRLGGR